MHFRPKLRLVLTGLAMAAFAVGAGPAKANIMFGAVSPTPACGPASGPGLVCGGGFQETFTNGTDTILANGFLTDAPPVPGVGNTHLTLKPFTSPPGPP